MLKNSLSNNDKSLSESRRILFTRIAVIVWVSTFAGCAKGTYTAKKLPPNLYPQPNISVRQIDLSRLPRTDTPSNCLSPGDVIEVSMATGAEVGEIPHWRLRINNDGNVDVPIIGPVSVAGDSASDAAQKIRDASIERSVYIDPKVTVVIEKKHVAQITVVGAVRTPSTYELPTSECNLLGALTAAEGLSPDADMTIEIRHSPTGYQTKVARHESQRLAQLQPRLGDSALSLSPPPKQTTTIQLTEIDALQPEDLELFDGSVVHVHRRNPRRAYIDGLVRQPKSIDLPEGENLTLLQAIAQAGGVTNSLASKVLVVRPRPDGSSPAVIQASLRGARQGGPDNLILSEGDIVTVSETPATYITDTMRSFFRVGFSAAMPGL